MESTRTPEIMADTAHAMLTRPAMDSTGRFFVDENVLREEGVEDFDPYRAGSAEPALDLFLAADTAAIRT
jgi:citronellol/citronellal dehydrogenase